MEIESLGVEIPREVIYFDEKDKRSVYNIAPKTIRDKMNRSKDLLLTDETELRKKVQPTATLNKLRLKFWKEYDVSHFEKRRMILGSIFNGICPAEQFHKYLQSKEAVAWILKPPTSYLNSLEEALSTGVDKLREILEVPVYQTQSVNIGGGQYEDREVFSPQIASLLVKTVAMLDLRVNGALVQKIEQKTYSENRTLKATINSNDIPKLNGNMGLDEKIQEMETLLREDISKLRKPSKQLPREEGLSGEDDL